MINRPRLLLSEDDTPMREYLALALRNEGYDVTECRTGTELVDRLGGARAEHTNYNLLISDIRMPGFNGLEVLEGLEGWPGLPPVILITAFGDAATHARARKVGALALIDKPFDLDIMLAIVRSVVDVATTNSHSEDA